MVGKQVSQIREVSDLDPGLLCTIRDLEDSWRRPVTNLV
jgi:hypothetical protein